MEVLFGGIITLFIICSFCGGLLYFCDFVEKWIKERKENKKKC